MLSPRNFLVHTHAAVLRPSFGSPLRRLIVSRLHVLRYIPQTAPEAPFLHFLRNSKCDLVYLRTLQMKIDDVSLVDALGLCPDLIELDLWLYREVPRTYARVYMSVPNLLTALTPTSQTPVPLCPKLKTLRLGICTREEADAIIQLARARESETAEVAGLNVLDIDCLASYPERLDNDLQRELYELKRIYRRRKYRLSLEDWRRRERFKRYELIFVMVWLMICYALCGSQLHGSLNKAVVSVVRNCC
ncbi:hypothetical protein PM082_006538 [Marasmius tenuissimus]|nr:hypothetical protein PM082_006538 [Marasmius tenuissimus]